MHDLSIDLRYRVGDFTLDVRFEARGAPVVLVGPNGAGKSTLLRLLAGGLVPDEGRVVVRGQTWVDTRSGVWWPPERRQVGYLPQGAGLFTHLSALGNVAFGMGRDRTQAERSATTLLERVGAAHLAQRPARELSGGEQQRVALARALSRSPRLLLLDEPTSAVDIGGRRAIRNMLREVLRSPDCSAIAVTHDLRDLLAWEPRIVLLDRGRVVAVGGIDDLARCGHSFAEELLAPLEEAGRGE